MKVERSAVPGYDATLVMLDHNERFALRNPDNPAQVVAVRTVTAFDHGTVDHPERAYFRVHGTDIGTQIEGELNYNFTDFGVLPPHVREALPSREGDPVTREPLDHAPEHARPPSASELSRYRTLARQREKRHMSADELFRLREQHGVRPGPQTPGRRSAVEPDAVQRAASVSSLSAARQRRSR